MRVDSTLETPRERSSTARSARAAAGYQRLAPFEVKYRERQFLYVKPVYVDQHIAMFKAL